MKWTSKRFNPKTLRVEQVPLTGREIARRVLWRVVALVLVAGGSVWTADRLFQSPADRAREAEIAFLESQLQDMGESVRLMEEALSDMERRDDEVYRTILGVEPVPDHVRNPGIGGSERHAHLRGHLHSNEVADLAGQIAALQRSIVAQSQSLDELTGMALEYEKLLESIPAIQPVRNEDFAADGKWLGPKDSPYLQGGEISLGRGFQAPPRAPEVFATGDGEVVKVKQRYNGYGRHIIVRHGFGYETLYAHLSKSLVRRGDKVKRGQVIGLVGSTGTSTSAHLHYEVHKNGQKVNPAHYYFNDLTPAQYEAMFEASEVENQSLD